jgi:hypothetical protein
MKMSEAFLCCDSCFALLAQQSTKAAKLWMDLCSIYNEERHPFGLIMDESPHFRMLELQGFITTTETDMMIKVKVHGLHNDEQGIYFCPRSCFDE